MTPERRTKLTKEIQVAQEKRDARIIEGKDMQIKALEAYGMQLEQLLEGLGSETPAPSPTGE